jgi:hypothetical protein
MTHGFIYIDMTKPWNIKNVIIIDEIVKLNIINYINNRKKTKVCNRVPIDENSKLVLSELYNKYGYKTIAASIGITYTVCRSLINNWAKIPTRKGYKIILESTKQFRSDRVKKEKNPWYDWTNTNIVKNSRGIQGYYRKKDNRFVWLRSTWEYIYAKWLDKNNIEWEYEGKQYKFRNGESYRPDFWIESELGNYIVEIKGYFKNRLYKIDMLRNEYPTVKIVVLDDITCYSENYNRDLKLWKIEILKNQKLKELES